MRVEEELRCHMANLRHPSEPLDGDVSWDLLNAARLLGDDWLSTKNEIDVSTVEEAFDACDAALLKGFQVAREDRANENADRINLQVESAKKHMERQMATQQSLLMRFTDQRKSDLVRMTRGRIRSIEKKFEMQFARFKQKASLTAEQAEVARGVIRVL